MLKFDTEGGEDEVLVDIDEGGPERLMNTFVKAGRIVFEVAWEPFGSLTLPVEEDVKFLAEAYEELPFFLSKTVVNIQFALVTANSKCWRVARPRTFMWCACTLRFCAEHS